MQVIYGANTASNILFTAQKRLIRPVYAQTQGYPYAASLDASFRNSDGSFRIPASGDTAGATYPLTRSAAAYTYQGSVIPGLVAFKTGGPAGGEYVCVGTETASLQPFGLLGQWLGGSFDNIGTNNQVGVWRGPDSVYELLAPAWNDTQVASAFSSATAGAPVLLYTQADGRLGSTNNGSQVAVASVLDRPSSARLLINLLI